MKFQLLDVITANAKYDGQEDGSINATGVVVKIGIVGAPEGKFIQAEKLPDAVSLPANGTNADNLNLIKAAAQAYVIKTYPNT